MSVNSISSNVQAYQAWRQASSPGNVPQATSAQNVHHHHHPSKASNTPSASASDLAHPAQNSQILNLLQAQSASQDVDHDGDSH